ncbi:ORF6N domain-containing protein [Pedobacter heparinus]|uniref:ORF6N domain-containing protein n=1 Tax=Pedobacter heparinus TaxID=984 RepID=UPI00292EE420|nr:ORF6N domain-containing protein [Pedobacter heparinus]
MTAITQEIIQDKIFNVRGKQVMLDRDLAVLYGVETKVLNQAVKRNLERFPGDFMFQLSKDELKSIRSQFVTLDRKGAHSKYLPAVFTEQGIAMLASVLRSETAILMSIEVMRAFVAMRRYWKMRYLFYLGAL